MADSVDFQKDNQDIVRRLINKQRFDGLWNFDTKIIQQLTGKCLSSFQATDNHLDNQILVSAIILSLLETRFAAFSSMWFGVVQKARKRLLDLLDNDSKNLDILLKKIRTQL
jgi:hypothetical protein